MPNASATPLSTHVHQPRPAAIANWLFCVAALIFLMVVVGGITRLTESGLSIVHWQPVSGAIPPLNTEQWQAAFDAYRTSPQYQQINHNMSLAAFKQIFFWEYIHRLLGRIIGLAFAIPLFWFAWKKAIPQGYGWRLTLLLMLGGLQGAIGWWMVASGLVDRPDVSHIRLAVHLLMALFIFAVIIWTALNLRALEPGSFVQNPHQPAPPSGSHQSSTLMGSLDLPQGKLLGGRVGEWAGAVLPRENPTKMPILAIWLLSLLGLQIMFGAYVAGLEAGYAFNSWPLMGDELFPSKTPMLQPFLANLVDNPIVVQFIHRWLAFLVAAMALVLAIAAWRRGFRVAALLVAGTVAAQIVLGIATIMTGVALWLAVAHQGMAAILLASILLAAHRLGSERA